MVVAGNELSTVDSATIPGVTISNDLNRNNHVNQAIKKANKHLYLLVLLKRAGVRQSDIVNFYCTAIRPVLEYRSPVFHHSLPEYLREDLERVQKRVFSILSPHQSCRQSLATFEISTLCQLRREEPCTRLFRNILDNNQLRSLLPPRHQSHYNTQW